MNMHKNARLTPSGRVLLVERIEAGWTVQHAATAAEVSERTAYSWLGRYRGGDRHLADRSSAPHHIAHRLSADRIAAIEHMRRQRQTGPAIARALGMARSSVGLVLRRLGQDRLQPRPPVICYACQRPGEMLHLDIKNLGKIGGIGHRITGRHALRHRARGIGYEHLHVAIDDAGRWSIPKSRPVWAAKTLPAS